MLKSNSGFTLIEVIATLVLAGILGAVAGRAVVTGAEGYIFAKENARLSQKAQLALARMTRELTELSGVTDAKPESIEFSTPAGLRGIGVNNGEIKISINSTNWAGSGFILANDVGSLTLNYTNGTGETWDGADISELAGISITLVLTHKSEKAGIQTFITTVNPRNTGNLNGPVG